MNDRSFIPYNLPAIGQEEIDEVTAVLRSGWVTTGPKAAQFEEEFRNYVGAKHALAVNSCTAGLHLALAALGIGPGDEVITTPLTFCSTVSTILHVGATPVLADTGDDGNVDPDSIALRITERTRAIVPVHLGGLPCKMARIWKLAGERGLFVVEDAAHGAGSHYQGSPLGGFNKVCRARSDVAAFSFYATKNMTTGEGGMVTSEDEELAERMRRLCLHGISNDAWGRYAERGSRYKCPLHPRSSAPLLRGLCPASREPMSAGHGAVPSADFSTAVSRDGGRASSLRWGRRQGSGPGEQEN